MTRIFCVNLRLYYVLILSLFFSTVASSQIVLMGDNAPFANVNDGDFCAEWGSWRLAKQSPFWETYAGDGENERKMGLDFGRLFSMNKVGIAESKILNTSSEYKHPKAGDIFNWSFGADLEYISDGTISLSLVFGKHERMLAEKVKLIGSDKTVEHFSGNYTLNEEDAAAGLPFVRATFYTSDDVKVFLDYVNISVVAPEKGGPELTASLTDTGIKLRWVDQRATADTRFGVYRMAPQQRGTSYKKLGETQSGQFLDEDMIHGIEYTYVVTRMDQKESAGSNKVKITFADQVAPAAPANVKALPLDAEVELSWSKSADRDVCCYSVFRRNANNDKWVEIACEINGTSVVDFTPAKDVENTYVVYAHDYSGNKSKGSEPVSANVKMVYGASFSDLILPMAFPKDGLRSDVWGAKNVLPRDPENGIESPDWSYWGGRPVKDKDGKFHMNVTRWPANATKGHWEWPNSTVAHVVSAEPTGPYRVVRETAYDYERGYGHNPDVVLLNDGSYLFYSLIKFEPHLFHSASMSGPWEHLGVMNIDTVDCHEVSKLQYRFERNLSGVQLDDGRILFVTKAGAMMMSQGTNPLGPYKVLTSALIGNEAIPEKYRNSNYEDPVLWKDEVQYHMIINAFLDYRAIYLRSADGIHWKFNPGTAYTPNNTLYADGTQNHWHKLERPHVITDEFGRATHLSLAAIDVDKEFDLARDNHNSKNLILPLVVPKRLTLLNKSAITAETKAIQIVILSEPGFDAQKDINLMSLRFGSSDEVDYGRGCKAVKSKKQGKDLMVEFDGEGNGIKTDDFAGKLLGKTKDGKLIIGYSKL